ncbi:hypothetical protein [Myroides sp.]|uniref:hypothetical protein n=1 Tax=Myroides sp. TaxID=1874736 RepID=UPI003F39CF1B
MRIKNGEYYFDDILYQNVVEDKGCLINIVVEFSNNKEYMISFYDKSRFVQDLEDELMENLFFFEENVMFLRSVTKENVLTVLGIIEEKKIYLRFSHL